MIHCSQHNTDTGGADHACSICGKSLSSASSLDRHMLVPQGKALQVHRLRSSPSPWQGLAGGSPRAAGFAAPPSGTCTGGCAAHGRAFATIGNMHGWVRAACIRRCPEAQSGVDGKQGGPLAVLPKAGGGLFLCRRAGAGLSLPACTVSSVRRRGVCSRWPAIPGLGLWLMGTPQGDPWPVGVSLLRYDGGQLIRGRETLED